MPTITFVLLASSYLAIFAMLHTGMASDRLKDSLRLKLGKAYGFYRLFYNLFNLGVLAGFYLLFTPHDRLLYRLPEALHPFAFTLLFAGLGLVLWVLLITFNFRDFAGLRFDVEAQEQRYAFKDDGPFRICRHPIYLGTFISFLASPHMTLHGAVFTVFIFVYGLLGSIPEERKLSARYGEAYRHYQTRTKRLIPFLL